MSSGRIALAVLGVVLFVIGYAGLFPAYALALVTGFYTVGLSGDGLHTIGVAGGAAAVGGIWALSSAFRRAH